VKLERITLLRPNMGDYRSSDGMLPLSIAAIAARTPSDVEVRFHDDVIETIPDDDTPDLAALTVGTFTARRAYDIADHYRARGVPVILGGHHPSLLPDEALEHADAVVIGDAEGNWEQLLADFRRGALRRRYAGDIHRPMDDVHYDRGIFRGKRYVPIEPVQYSRGCRFVCDFCSIRAFYRDSLRHRPQERLVAELQELGTRKMVFFVDDNLFGSIESLNQLLEAIRPLGIRWSCQISIDVARDEQLLDRMAAAGCQLALIGFESLSRENLKQMAKPWNRVAGDYLSVVRRFHERGVAVYGTFVFGYDHDTTDTIRQSLDFALEARLEIANFNPLTPTPGTPLYDRLLSEGRLLSPRWWLDPAYRYGDPIFRPRGMTPDEFAGQCYEAKRDFYSWRSITTRVLGSHAGLDWFRTGMVGLANIISRREIIRKQYRAMGSTTA
jgi:radical SAM superfamily enzyme YgiQ (UPF0313 family)